MSNEIYVFIQNIKKLEKYLNLKLENKSTFITEINDIIDIEEVKGFYSKIPLNLNIDDIKNFCDETGFSLSHSIDDGEYKQFFDKNGSYADENRYNQHLYTGKYSEDIDLYPDVDNYDITIVEIVKKIKQDYDTLEFEIER